MILKPNYPNFSLEIYEVMMNQDFLRNNETVVDNK